MCLENNIFRNLKRWMHYSWVSDRTHAHSAPDAVTVKRWISTRQPSSASWSQTRCCTLTALSASVCILPYCGSRGAVVSEWRGNMHKSEALECPWWIMDGMQRFCQQNNSSGVSKWGLKLLLLKTKHCSSVYNQIEWVVGCASVPQDTDVCSIHCSGKKRL